LPGYHASLYDWSAAPQTIWHTYPHAALPSEPLTGDASADVAILGGGYCGLSAAYHLACAGIETRVLEAGPIGWGASGRNAGFCCIGASLLDAASLRARYGETATLEFYRELVEAVDLVRDIADREAIDLDARPGGIWTFAHKPDRIAQLRAQADVLGRIGVTARIVSADTFAREAFACTESFGALHEPVGFGMNPLAWCLGLARAAAGHGARIHDRSRALAWRREARAHRIQTAGGALRAERVIVATNGWLPVELAPELAGRVLPILSNIVVTRPLTEPELAAQSWRTHAPASNTRAHLAYLRLLPDRRLLFGGRGDTTGTPAAARAMQAVLMGELRRLFPAFAGVEVTHFWRGFITATPRLTPAIAPLADDASVQFAAGCHGNGVAFMTWAGRELARRLLGVASVDSGVVGGRPSRLPLHRLWPWPLRAALAWARLTDAR
jgi:glycine/D-amino acid oxidase-like deaminating enzyme